MPNALRMLARALRGACRLVALRRASLEDFPPVPELFAALVAIDIGLMVVFSMVAFGMRGELNVYELSRALLYVPMVLLVGMFARRAQGAGPLLTLPVALAAASVVMNVITSALYVLAQRQLLPFAETYWFVIDYVVLAWSAAIVMNAGWRLAGGRASSRLAAGAAAFVLVVVPSFVIPQGLVWAPQRDESAADANSSFYSLAEERAFYAQQAALERELEAVEPQRPGVTDLYAIVAGMYAGEDVFMKEANMISALLEKRFDTRGRTVTLINNVKTLGERPIATLTSLRESLARVGELMNRDEDVLLLYVSSHGSDAHELAVDFRPLRLEPITPERLKSALDDSGIRWKVVIVSACYSGGYVDALEDDYTLVITAARADRTSFGCGSASDATYLAKALFGEGLAKTYSFEGAFAAARARIEQWEQEKGQKPPSEPQMYVGAKVRPKLAELERRLAGAHKTASHRAQR